MDLTTLFIISGFLAATYSIIGNDAMQVYGTYKSSNTHIKWQWQWLFISSVITATLTYSWFVNNGDISSGRLNRIPEQTIQWYHAIAPFVLIILTRKGLPVSTTFLVLSAFASSVVLEQMIIKSMMGYALAATIGYALWLVVTKYFDEEKNPIKPENAFKWRILQWSGTAFLVYSWFSQDAANFAVFLPRSLSVNELIGVLLVIMAVIAIVFREKDNKIQRIVQEKRHTSYVRSATIIDFIYAFILLFFKQYNDIPMSTTWVFVGLLTGRELAMSSMVTDYKFSKASLAVGKDLLKMFFGLSISVGSVLLIIHFAKP